MRSLSSGTTDSLCSGGGAGMSWISSLLLLSSWVHVSYAQYCLKGVGSGEFSTMGRLTGRMWCLLMPLSAKSEGQRTIRFRMKHDTSSKQQNIS